MRINIREENILARMDQPGSVNQLAVFRILMGLQIFYSSSSKIFQYVLQVPDIAHTKNIFPVWLNLWVETIAIPYLQPVTQILGIFLALGLIHPVHITIPFYQLYVALQLLFFKA